MMIISIIFLLWVQLIPTLLINPIFSSPPENPITCKSHNRTCKITNSIAIFPDRSICKAAEVVYPATEKELINIIAKATQTKQKMKVATRYSHSIPKLACSDGEDGLLISTNYLNKVVEIDKAARTITVESGVLLKDLIEEAAKAGLALPYTPYWYGLTIGGLLSTGSHGSSLWYKGSAVHEYVIGVRIISPGESSEDGYVKVRALDVTDEDLNAAKVSLGVLGVISLVTLQLEPLFKRSITYEERDDHDVSDQALKFGRKYEFADMIWYPSQKKVMYRIDHRVPSNMSGNGLYNLIWYRPVLSAVVAARTTIEKLQEATNNADEKCRSAKFTMTTFKIAAFGLTNDGVLFTGYPVVGYQNRLQSSGTCLNSLEDALLTACPEDPRIPGRILYHQTTFSITLPKVKSFIEDVQKLVRMNPKSMCGAELYNGILMRYVKGSSAYMGKEEDSLDFDITYFRSKNPLTPRMYEDIIEEIEQMALFKYKALPHWGKNRNLAFDGIINRYKRAGEFLDIKEKFDPMGLFSSQWSDQILGLQGGLTIIKNGCALEGLCICSDDSHCAPHKGYYCRPGKVYKEARVCEKL